MSSIASWTACVTLTFDVLTTPERLRMLERLERGVRRQRTPQHVLINQLTHKPARRSWAARCVRRLANRLRITKAEAAGGSPTPPISGNGAR